MLWSGCAIEQQVALDPLGAAPLDFSLDVTVMAGKDVDPAQQAQSLCGRYVFLPDGTLRQSVDPSGHGSWGARWLPEQTRTLTRQQSAQLWSLIQQLGFAEPAAGDRVFNFDLVHPAPGEITYLIGVRGREKRWNFARSHKAGDQGDPAALRLVHALAELSWSSAASHPEGYIMPPRYDFGPDPYARYRSGEGK